MPRPTLHPARRPCAAGHLLALALAVLALLTVAAPAAHAAFPCGVTASSSQPPIGGTTAARAVDGSTSTFLRTAYNDWQLLQMDLGCPLEISSMRRHMTRDGSNTTGNRGAQGESWSYSLDGVNWTYVPTAGSSGWSAYVAYHVRAWHSVVYGWSAWLSPSAPIYARYLRFHWDGDSDALNEVELNARPAIYYSDLRLTQNGLVTRTLPPLPIVAGKNTLLRGTVNARSGGPTAIDSARVEVFRQDTGALSGSTTGYAFAADDVTLLSRIPVGQDVHFFIPGSQLAAETSYRFEGVYTAAGITYRVPLLANISAQENEGVSVVFTDYDDGTIQSLSDLLQFIGAVNHTARMLPIKNSIDDLLSIRQPTAGAAGLRFDSSFNLPLAAEGSAGNFEREYVFQGMREGTGGAACSAAGPSTFFANRFLAYNFTFAEDADRNGSFSQAELNRCTPGQGTGGNSPMINRIANFGNQSVSDQDRERRRIASRESKELAKYTLQLASGGQNRQNHTGWLGNAGPRAGWATVSMSPSPAFPAMPHELSHELGRSHSTSNNPQGPGYDLFLRRRVPQPFDVMNGGFPPNQTLLNSFLTDADFDAMRTQIPRSSNQEGPSRTAGTTLLVQGALTSKDEVTHFEVVPVETAVEAASLREDLELVVLDEHDEPLAYGSAELSPVPAADQPAGLAAFDGMVFRGEVPGRLDAAAVALFREGRELHRYVISGPPPTVTLLSHSLNTDPVTVSWKSTNSSGVPRYDLYVEYPDGRVVTLGSSMRATSLSVPADRFPGGTVVDLHLVAFDGFKFAQDRETGLSVDDRLPKVVIVTPTTGQTSVAGGSLFLIANASDAEDGALDGTSVEWSSSRDGFLGTGTILPVTLSTGTHVLTVEARDSIGQLATAQVTLTVQ